MIKKTRYDSYTQQHGDRYTYYSRQLLKHLPSSQFRTTFEKAIPTKNAEETTSFPPFPAENKYYTII